MGIGKRLSSGLILKSINTRIDVVVSHNILFLCTGTGKITPQHVPSLTHNSPGGLSYNVTLQEQESPPGEEFYTSGAPNIHRKPDSKIVPNRVPTKNGSSISQEWNLKSKHYKHRSREHLQERIKNDEIVYVTPHRKHKKQTERSKSASKAKSPFKVTNVSKTGKGKATPKPRTTLMKEENTKSNNLPGFNKLDNLLRLSFTRKNHFEEVIQHLIDIGRVTIDAGVRMINTEKSKKLVSRMGESAQHLSVIGQRLIIIGKKILSRGEKLANATVGVHITKSITNAKDIENNLFAHFGISPTSVSETSSLSSTISMPVIKMVSLCSHGPTHHGVTLRGGLRAGKFTPQGKMDSIKGCVKRCCANEGCNLAFVVQQVCYTVACDSALLCELVPARQATLNEPQVVYLWRGIRPKTHKKSLLKSNYLQRSKIPTRFKTQRGIVRHTKKLNHHQCLISKLHCKKTIFMRTMEKGTWLFLGHLTKERLCRLSCCKIHGCNVALYLQGRCYALACYRDHRGCPLIPDRKDIPHIALHKEEYPAHLSWNPSMIQHFKTYLGKNKDKTSRDTIGKTLANCPYSKLYSRVILRRGMQAGDFTYFGKVTDVKQCLTFCCQTSSCDLVFMLDGGCYLVNCYSEPLCRVVASHQHTYKTQVIFVTRRFNKGKRVLHTARPTFLQVIGNRLKENVEEANSLQKKTTKLVSKTSYREGVTQSTVAKSNVIEDKTYNPTKKTPLITTKLVNHLPVNNQTNRLLRIQHSKIGKKSLPGMIKFDFGKSNATKKMNEQLSIVSKKEEDIKINLIDREKLNIKVDYTESEPDDMSGSYNSVEMINSGDGIMLSNDQWQIKGESGKGAVYMQSNTKRPQNEPEMSLESETRTISPTILADKVISSKENNKTAKERNSLGTVDSTGNVNGKDSKQDSRILQDNTANSSGVKDILPSSIAPSIDKGRHIEPSISLSSRPHANDQKCLVEEVLHNVTLMGGFRSGTFTAVDYAKSMDECSSACCQSESCDMIFMVLGRCFMVRCHNIELCQPVKAKHAAQFRPQIAYVGLVTVGSSKATSPNSRSTKQVDISQNTLNSTDYAESTPDDPLKPVSSSHSNKISKYSNHYTSPNENTDTVHNRAAQFSTSSECIAGEVMSNTTLRQGFNAGRFSYQPNVSGMELCVKRCCEDTECDVAFIIRKSCYTVKCTSIEMCEASYVKHSVYFPRLVFVSHWVPKQKHFSVTVKDATVGMNRDTQMSLQSNRSEESSEDRSSINYSVPQHKEIQTAQKKLRNPSSSSNFGQSYSHVSLPKNPATSGIFRSLNTIAKQEDSKHIVEKYSVDSFADGSSFSGSSNWPVSEKIHEPSVEGEAVLYDQTSGAYSETEDNTVTDGVNDVVEKMVKIGHDIWATDHVDTRMRINHPTDMNKHLPPSDPVASSKLRCLTGPVMCNVTLRGGYGAGNFTDRGIVNDMDSCKRICCQADLCDVAFVIKEKCYTVVCFSNTGCQPIKASFSERYRPSIVYITNTSSSNLSNSVNQTSKAYKLSKTNRNVDKIMEDNESNSAVQVNDTERHLAYCNLTGPLYDVTLKGGFHAGTFTNRGTIQHIEECVYLCCQSSNCDLAFVIRNVCFNVQCNNAVGCSTTAAHHAEKYHPKIVYVRRINVSKDFVTKTDQLSYPKPTSINILHQVNELNTNESTGRANISTSGTKRQCQFSKVKQEYTLLQGASAGNFVFAGQSADMDDCIKHCCRERSCDVALRLKENCYLVKCHTMQSCYSIPATPSEYHPMIAFKIKGKLLLSYERTITSHD